MNPGYRFPNQPVKPGDAVKPEDTHVMTALNVKSAIFSPGEGATVKGSKVSIHGTAWAGEAEIAKVEVSTDGGATWGVAKLGPVPPPYARRQCTSGSVTPISRD